MVWELFACVLWPDGATLRRFTFKSFLATWISLSSFLRDSRTWDVVSSSSSSRLTWLSDSPISECVMKPEVRDMLTDWLMEFICSDLCSTVWNLCQLASFAASGRHDLLSWSLRVPTATPPRFINLTSCLRILYLAPLLLPPFVPKVEEFTPAASISSP